LYNKNKSDPENDKKLWWWKRKKWKDEWDFFWREF
jgi:hypothetical protein